MTCDHRETVRIRLYIDEIKPAKDRNGSEWMYIGVLAIKDCHQDEVFGARPEDVFGSPVQFGTSSSHLDPSSSHLDPSSSHLGDRDMHGRLISEHLDLPVIDDLSKLSLLLLEVLENGIAQEPRRKKKVGREVLISAILKVCDGHYVTLKCLAEIVNRKPIPLRNNYLTELVKEQKLSLAFPTTPTHERQAYCTTSSLPGRAPEQKT
jgi:hypothetical protein